MKSLIVGFFVITVLLLIMMKSKNHGLADILRLVVLLPFFVVDEINSEVIKRKKIILYTVPLLMLVYSFYYGICNQERFIFSSNDPNFSAVYLMMGFLIAYKISAKKLAFIFFCMGMLTESRNFLLFIIVFYFIRFTKEKNFFRVVYKISPLWIFLLLQLLIILLGMYMLLYVEFDNDKILADGSNKTRFIYTIEGIDYLLTNKSAIWEGAGQAYWSVARGGTGAAGTTGALHNSYLSLIVEKGIIYSFLNLMFLFIVVKKHRNNNYEYIYSFLVPSLFLGGLFSGVFLFMWCFILCVNKNDDFLEYKSK